jgi:cobalt-zinc-cadmium efflux system outer membrane protein
MILLSIILAAAAADPAAPAAAEPALPPLLGLRQALEIFDRRGFDLLVAEASVKSAEGDLAIASAVQNPGFSATAGRSYSCGSSQDCSVISYSLALGDNNAISDVVSGKLGLRKSVARNALEAARRSRDDARRTLAFQVKQAFFQAALAAVLSGNARETRDSYLRTQQLNEHRFAIGAISRADLLTIQVASLESEQAVDQAEEIAASARLSLAFLLGFRSMVPAFQVDTAELDYRGAGAAAQPGREALISAALENRPDRGALRAQVRRAQTALTLTHRNRIPDVGLSVAWSANGSGNTNISPPGLAVGLSFALPVFYFQGGDIAKAEADLATQEVLEEKAQAQVVNDVESALAQLSGARKLVERMREPLLERASEARDIVRFQYEKGAASLLDLLNAERTYTAVRAEYAGDLASYWTAVALLEEATAKSLSKP